MLGKKLNTTPMEALFLMVLRNTAPLSGSAIVQKLKEDLGEEWSPTAGATYKIIQSLEKKGYIEDVSPPKEKRADQRVRIYALTTEGKNVLPNVTSRIRKVLIFAANCCPESTEGLIIVEKKDVDAD